MNPPTPPRLKSSATSIAGSILIEPTRHQDDRGWFTEILNQRDLLELGIRHTFVQINHSQSQPQVIRGLHFQVGGQEAKLVRCVRGHIWDVIVDLRQGSPHFGMWFGCDLTAENGRSLFVPPGCAHGFCVQGSQTAEVIYATTTHYNPAIEGGIAYNDPHLGITWPITTPIVSQRDQALGSFNADENQAGAMFQADQPTASEPCALS